MPPSKWLFFQEETLDMNHIEPWEEEPVPAATGPQANAAQEANATGNEQES